jgi:hypothetical protein
LREGEVPETYYGNALCRRCIGCGADDCKGKKGEGMDAHCDVTVSATGGGREMGRDRTRGS